MHRSAAIAAPRHSRTAPAYGSTEAHDGASRRPTSAVARCEEEQSLCRDVAVELAMGAFVDAAYACRGVAVTERDEDPDERVIVRVARELQYEPNGRREAGWSVIGR